MPDMQQIEAAIGKHDFAAEKTQASYAPEGLFEGKDFGVGMVHGFRVLQGNGKWHIVGRLNSFSWDLMLSQ